MAKSGPKAHVVNYKKMQFLNKFSTIGCTKGCFTPGAGFTSLALAPYSLLTPRVTDAFSRTKHKSTRHG